MHAPGVTVAARHREILRLTLLGWTTVRIAAQLDMSADAVRVVLRSPLMVAELEKMQEEADRLTVNTPLRAQIEGELRGATIEAVRLNRRMMNDGVIDSKVRTRIAAHFMDRVLFDKVDDERGSTYRDILKKLDDLDRQIARGAVPVIEATATVEAAGAEGATGAVATSSIAKGAEGGNGGGGIPAT